MARFTLFYRQIFYSPLSTKRNEKHSRLSPNALDIVCLYSLMCVCARTSGLDDCCFKYHFVVHQTSSLCFFTIGAGCAAGPGIVSIIDAVAATAAVAGILPIPHFVIASVS